MPLRENLIHTPVSMTPPPQHRETRRRLNAVNTD